LLVDGDLRRPSLHRQLLGISPNGRGAVAGLSDVIVGQCKLDQAIKQTAFANLSILPAGAIPPNPNELLASQRMRTLVDEMSPRADFILFDSPPCLLFTDAFLLAQITNGVLFVLRAGTQDKAAQRRVQKQLQQAKARVLGVVFNDVEVDDSASSSYYYETDAKRRR
jgi:capsular exopolysaccharide synthesis family protein